MRGLKPLINFVLRLRFAVNAALFVIPCDLQADVRPARVFGDGMVLQQKKPVPIWGWAEPGENVTIQFASQTVKTVAGSSGAWKVVLGPLTAGGPSELSIIGKNTITLKEVFVGEVWLCSGQSNMALTMQETRQFMAPEIALPPNPSLRVFCVSNAYSDKPEDEIRGGVWRSSSARTIPGFPATPYYFGKFLQKDLNIPVGLITSTIGGTSAQAWISRGKLALDAETNAIAEQEIQETLQGIETNKLLAKDDKKRFPDWRIQNTSSYLFNAMIHPLAPYGIAGFAWYQGEHNEANPESYRKLFPQLISNWRQCWEEPDLPFLFCQLPGNRLAPDHTGKRPFLREAQASVLSLPNTGMAVLIDLGEEESNHPRDKAPVGERLARIALAKTYGKKIECSGPVIAGAVFDGEVARIRFQQPSEGLRVKSLSADYQPDTLKAEKKPLVRNSPNSEVEGFAVAGSDQRWVWADARIDGDTVIVSSLKVPNPVAVRYAWSDFPICNLYNQAGLPASPFRSDAWPMKRD